MSSAFRYNAICPAHEDDVSSWVRFMREGDIVCTKCYHRLPKHVRRHLWDENPATQKGSWSIVIDWLKENSE